MTAITGDLEASEHGRCGSPPRDFEAGAPVHAIGELNVTQSSKVPQEVFILGLSY